MNKPQSYNHIQIIQYGLKPAISTGCKVLIVGSFPSSLSLAHNEYYANPRNNFWKIIEAVLNMPSDLDYSARIHFLGLCNIGLYDVISSCIRQGSSDNSIKDATPSPIGSLLCQYPTIRTILCNGRKAESGIDLALHTPEKPNLNNQITIKYLPSSSPAHTIQLQKKCESWMIIRDLALTKKIFSQ